MIESFLIGVLSSSLVARADQYDNEVAEKKSAKAGRLREIARNLRSPQQLAGFLVNETLRHGVAAELAETVGSDPLLGHELAQWVLAVQPTADRNVRGVLLRRLTKKSGLPAEEIGPFLDRLRDRVFAHPELARIRADGKLDALLGELSRLRDLRGLVESHQLYVSLAIRKLLKPEWRRHLKPVCPEIRPWTLENGLLHGNRPTDEDMDEEIDFTRGQFPKVMQSIEQIDVYPAALVFLADPQQGKTTFLKRVGWELAKRGRAVVQLDGSVGAEPYGPWLHEAAQELPQLVVLIDDPHVHHEHFVSQMMSLDSRGSQILCLIASRRSDWEKVESERAAVLQRAQNFELLPTAGESEQILRHLVDHGIVTVEEDSIGELFREIQGMPVKEAYFHSIIQVASDDRYRPTPVLVEERLQEAGSGAESFERLYGHVCLFGMVGLSLPGMVASSLMPDEEERYQARQFSESLPNPPMRWQEGQILASHESHAAAFFETRDLEAQLVLVLEVSCDAEDLRDPMGTLLRLLQMRGHSDLTADAWSSVSGRIPERYWESCSPTSLVFSWGTFLYKSGLTEEALALTRHASARSTDPFLVVTALFNQGVALSELERPEEALAVYEDVVARFGDRDELALAERVAKALVYQGVALNELERPEEELAVYEDVVARFGDRDELALAEWVAKALFNQGVTLSELERPEEALAVYEDVVARFGDRDELALAERVAKALVYQGVALNELERPEEELAVYEDVVARFGDRDELALAEWVAKALVYQGVALNELERPEEELAVYEDVVARFGDRDELALAEWVAKALFNQGVTLSELERPEEALAVYEDVVARFGDRDELALAERVAKALVYQGVALNELERPEEELAVYEDVVARFGDRDELALAEWVAKALVYQGVALNELERPEEALAVYEDVVARFGDRDELALAEWVAKALFNQGVTLGQLERPEEELAVYEDVVARFGDRDELALAEWVAKALVNQGVTLGQLERPEEALAVYEDVVARFGDRDELALAEWVAKALVNQGVTLGQLERPEEELAVYEDVVARFGDRDELALAEWVAKALVNQGVTLGQLERPEEALAVYEDVVARFGDRDELALAEWVAKALVNQGVTLGHLERPEEALAVYEDVVARFGDRDELALAEWVAKALVNQGVTLGHLERPEEKLAVYEDVVARFGDRDELALAEWVAKALVYQGVALNELERPEEALAVYEDVVARFGDRDELALAEWVAAALEYSGATLSQCGADKETGSEDQRSAWEQAERALREAARRRGKPLFEIYNYACLLAVQGQKGAALQALQRCLDAGSISAEHVRNDPDWEAFRGDPDFESLL